MSDDFEERLRSSLRAHSPSNTPASLDLRVGAAIASRRVARSRRPLRVTWAIAGVAVVVAVIGSAFAYRENANGPAGTTASPIPAATADVRPPPLAANWVRGAEPTGVVLTAVAADSTGYLALGGHTADSSPTLWRSSDGLTWSKDSSILTDMFAPTKKMGKTTVNSLAVHESSVVAAGSDQVGDYSAGDAAVWYSADGGRAWQRADVAGAADATIFGVAWGPSGWVAVGADGYPGASTQMVGTRGMAVWTSLDGSAWSRVATSASFSEAVPYHIVVSSLGYVASGLDLPDREVAGAPIWLSQDGVNWSRVGAVSASMAVATTSAGGVSTFVEQRDGTLAAWNSANGVNWSRTTLSSAPSAQTRINSFGSMGGHLLAFGDEVTSSGGRRLVVWDSYQGGSWHRLPDNAAFEGATSPAVVQTGAGILVFGETYQSASASPPGGYTLVVLSGS
jgi:hypothetical protein